MKKFFGGWIMALMLPLLASAAERYREPPDPNDPLARDPNAGGGLLTWEYPVYPAEPQADWTEEHVKLSFVVEATGAVGEIKVLSGPERFQGPALAALKKWKFKPLLLQGKPSAVAREVNLPFKPTGTPARSIKEDYFMTLVRDPELIPPGDPYNSEPLYPGFLAPRRLAGEVELLLGISPEGRVQGVQVIRSPHPDFLSAALATVAAWECRPAQLGLMAVASKKQAVLSFYTTDEAGSDNHADWMELNGIFLRGPVNTKIAGYFDQPVEAVRMVDPVYPRELAAAGTRGGARVDFTINARGRVNDISVAEATAPEFGAALAAAIAAWQFLPLQRGGETVAADFSISWRFAEPRENSPEQRLLAGNAEILENAHELDRPLFPLFTRAGIFPEGRLDAGESGKADIEVIIDRDGRVRLPRVRGASGPEFGWAAATAVSQWLFETPLKNGKPVDVRVVIPLEFKAPPAAPNPLAKPENAREIEKVPLAH